MAYLDYEGLKRFKNYITQSIDDIVKVQDTKPIETTNKIWVNSTSQSDVQIPTYAEYLLNAETIENTVQSYVFKSGTDELDRILHKRGNTVIRTDVYTFTEDTVTEVRTLNTGESLTISTDINTMTITVTYVSA